MRYLITGHTGFKGSWLSAMLKIQGHEVCGIALEPDKKSLYNEANVSKYVNREYRLDIRNLIELRRAYEEIQPDVLIHLAAQPLVRASYSDPVGTYETNVLGTLNVLEATRYSAGLKAALIITTDKVYKNKNQTTGYRESDELGGSDPYSSSKAAADIATQSWRSSFGTFPIAIARAGNVIGGGDWSKDRLIPDIVSAIQHNTQLTLRNPDAIRPWQHVLDCLNGYLMLINKQISTRLQGEWNFGPLEKELKTVNDLAQRLISIWGTNTEFELENSNLKEAQTLVLNSEKSRDELGWTDKLDFDNALTWTVDYYKSQDKPLKFLNQINEYIRL